MQADDFQMGFQFHLRKLGERGLAGGVVREGAEKKGETTTNPLSVGLVGAIRANQPTPHLFKMKPKFHCFHLIPVLAAGMMISPLAAQSPERGVEPPCEAPQPERIRATVRQIVELHKAGKHDEARAISQRLRGVAKENPQAAKQIYEAMREQRQQLGAQAPEGPQRPQTRQRPMEDRDPMKMRGKPPEDRQSPMANPQAGGPKPPVVRPNVEAAKQGNVGAAKAGEIAKIRHLKQAVEHLAAAGFTDHAAKAREEVGRMEAALKAATPPPPAQMKEQRKPKEMKDQVKPKTPERPDVNGRVVAELQKLSKQMAELSKRVRKLEAQDDSEDD